tara:strand:- start:2279 stop:2602 length:324 start_codon:yes stop_codon:yes gene_type:complete
VERIVPGLVENQDVDKILEARGKVYGSFGEGIRAEATILQVLENLYLLNNTKPMPNLHRSYLFRIIIKLSRLGVSPEHLDSWKDIEGYAKLTYNDIVENTDAKNTSV